MEILPYEPAMHDEWQTLVDRSPQAWMFHRREFIETVNQAMSQKECSLVAIRNDRMIAILPLNYYTPEHPPKMGSVSLGAAGPALDLNQIGPKEKERVTGALIERALEITRDEKCKALLVNIPPLAPTQFENTHGVSPLDPFGFSAVSTSTYIIDITPNEETLFKNLRRLAKRQIKRAQKVGVTIRRANRESDLETYYSIHCDTYHRTGAIPHPRGYFEGIFGTFAQQGLARIWAAEHAGKVIGYLSVAHFKNAAFSWTACSTEGAKELGVNYLLRWHTILDAKALGNTHYEVGEAFPGHRGDKLAGLDGFKSAFGGERWPFHKGRIDLAQRGKRPSRLRLSLYYAKQALKALTEKR